MLLDKRNTTNCRLMWDCEFYFRLIKGFIGFNNGIISAMLSSVVVRECTVFVQEAIDFEQNLKTATEESTSKLFKKSFPVLRDKTHYFTSQPFSYYAEKETYETIINGIQQSFFTRPKDDMYHSRNDLSYVKSNGLIYCSSIDMYALTHGTAIEKNGEVFGEAIMQYCKDLASIISGIQKGFSKTGESIMIQLQDLSPKQNLDVSFYDGKFDVAVESIECSEFITALALRMLNDIGTLRFVVDTGFDDNWSDTNVLYFIVRLIAIRFDEISDAIYKISTEFPEEESKQFVKLLTDAGVLPFPENIRQAAKRLRNSIHYNSDSEIWSIDFSKPFYWYNCFLKQASVKSYPVEKWPDGYIELKNEMMEHLDKLHKLLSSIFDCELKLAD